MTWIWFMAGAVLGATVGIVTMCFMQIAAQSDRNEK